LQISNTKNMRSPGFEFPPHIHIKGGVPGCGLSSPASTNMQYLEGQCPNQTRRWPRINYSASM